MQHFALRVPDGKAGKVAVLRFMSRLASNAVARDPRIRRQAAAILRSWPGPTPATPRARAMALLAFVAHRILYTPDPNELETLQTPGATLELGIGDCDDLTTLLLALARAVGIRARPVGLGEGGRFFHVAPELFLDGRWTWADPSLPRAALGAFVPLSDRLNGPEA